MMIRFVTPFHLAFKEILTVIQISSQWVPCGRRAGLTMTGIILMDDGNFETAAERMSHEFVYLECGMFLALPELLRSNIGREILRESLGLEQDILSGWLNLTPFHLNEDGLDFRLRRVGGNYVVSPFGSVSGYSTTGEELIGTGAGCMLWEKTPTEGQYDLEDHTTLGRFSVDSSDGHATEGQNNSEDHTTLSRFSVDSSDGHATWTRWLYKWCLPCLGSCRG